MVPVRPSSVGEWFTSGRRGMSMSMGRDIRQEGRSSPTASMGGMPTGGVRGMGMTMGVDMRPSQHQHSVRPSRTHNSTLQPPNGAHPRFPVEFALVQSRNIQISTSRPPDTSPRGAQFMQNHTEPVTSRAQCPNEECPICLEGADAHACIKIKKITGCSHLIGRACLEEMLNRQPDNKKECPLCRTEWIPEDGIWQDSDEWARLAQGREHERHGVAQMPGPRGGREPSYRDVRDARRGQRAEISQFLEGVGGMGGDQRGGVELPPGFDFPSSPFRPNFSFGRDGPFGSDGPFGQNRSFVGRQNGFGGGFGSGGPPGFSDF